MSSSATLDELQRTIVSLQRDRDELVASLAQVNLSLSRARAEYSAEKNRTALISSILPNEILAKIFEFGRNLNAPGDVPFEIVVSQVIARWRVVAIETPSLWNILIVSSAKQSTSPWLAAYMARAKACPLEIKFSFGKDIWMPEQQVWDVLISAVDRWRSLTISVDLNDAVLYNTLAHLEPLHAPLLEEIRIRATYDNSPMISQGFRNSEDCFLAGAPLLTSMELEGTYLYANWPPLTGLTTLHLHKFRRSARPNWDQLSELLTSPVVLLNLSVYGDVVRGRTPDDFEIRLPYLRSLRIRGTGLLGDRASDLLLSIVAPSVQSLTLYDMVDADLVSVFEHVPAPLFDSVTTLAICFPNFKAGDAYLRLCSIFPSVTNLVVLDRWPRSLLLRLGHPQTIDGVPDRYIWPLLSDFALFTGKSVEEDLHHMVQDRAGHVPLQQIRFANGAPIPGVSTQVLAFDLPLPWPAWPECLE